MSVSKYNTNGKRYYSSTADITNVRYTDIDREPTRVFITKERVPGVGPGVSLTKEILKRPKEYLSPIKTYIDRDSDRYENYMFNRYVFDTGFLDGPEGPTKASRNVKLENEGPKKKELDTVDKIARSINYASTFHGNTNTYGNRVGGRKLRKTINEAKSYYE